MNKKILAKLMELDNEKVDKYLNKFANEIKDNILRSKDNDEIFKNLELLGEFVYKVPEQTLIIIRTVIENKKSNKVKIYKGGFSGKEYDDLASECIDLLKKIRYIKLPEVLGTLVFLYVNGDEKIKSESAKALELLARYDLKVLNKIGYSAQRKILDTILKWKEAEKIKNIEAIKIIAKELLDSSFEGVTMKDYKTMVFHSGALQPTDFLKKIRRETIGLILFLYNHIEDIKPKISLLEVLNYASHTPTHSIYGEELKTMIIDDIKYLVDIYHKIIFSNGSQIIIDVPVAQEVEKQLIWFNKNYKDKIPEITALLSEIRKDEFYSIYRILVGDIYDYWEEEGHLQEAKETKKNKVDIEFEKINKSNIKKWSERLNLIANYKDVIDEWKLQVFQGFLLRIAKEKPTLAKMILDDALTNEKPLEGFIGQFLFGFRQGNHIKLWDEYIEKIIASRDFKLLTSIPASLSVNADLKKIRKKDIDLLSKIVKREKPFEFLDKAGKDLLIMFNYSLIRTLTNLYGADKKRIESLIISLIKKEKEKQNLRLYIEQLSFPAHKDIISLSEWGKENIGFILDILIELKDLNYDAQILLLDIAKKDFPSATEVFIKRIKKRSEMTAEKWISSLEYDAIPHHFNDELRQYLSGHKEYPKIVEGWIEDMTLKWSLYNIELAQFIQTIDGPIFEDILLKIIRKGNEKDLAKATFLLHRIDFSYLRLCFEIIKKTDDKDILNRVGGMMFNTGVVTGEYGIVKAHKNRAQSIKEYKAEGTKKEKERIEKFKEKMIKELEESAEREKQRADEEKKIMESEFEG